MKSAYVWALLVTLQGQPPQEATAKPFDTKAGCEWVRLTVFERTKTSSTKYECVRRRRQ